MRIGLIDVDGHNFPNLPLIKIAAWHKAQGDIVERWWGWEHMELLNQLEESKAWVDVNQGFDARLLTPENIAAIKRLKIKEIHFAWDQMKNSKRIIRGLNTWKRFGKKNSHGSWGTVYVLTNFDTTMAENLFRIYKLREMGFDPYVMIYDKPNAPYEVRLLQRWCNNKIIFKSCPRFEDYDPRRG